MSLKSAPLAEYTQDAPGVTLSMGRETARRPWSSRATMPAHIGAERLGPPIVPSIQLPWKKSATPGNGAASMDTSGLSRVPPGAMPCQLGFDSKADGPPPVPLHWPCGVHWLGSPQTNSL